MKQQKIIVIAGPTGSGKSAAALAIAEKTGGVIINADSQQVYRELRVLTARPTVEEEARAPHKLYGTMSADEACSVGKWLKFAKMEIDWALSMGALPIVCGGTGLYLKALIEGLAEMPEIDPAIRQQAISDLEAMGAEAFHERLRAVDPAAAERIRPSDPQRMTRAYEVWLGTGKNITWWQGNKNISGYNKSLFRTFSVELEREILYDRLNSRFGKMLETGALEEVRQLLMLDLDDTLPVMRIIGVPELAAHLRGEMSLQEATDKATQATRNYAKRQVTWFNNQLPEAVRVQATATREQWLQKIAA